MKKYYQLILVVVCIASVVALLVYRHEYNHLRYVLEVLNFFGKPGGASDANMCIFNINASGLEEKLDIRYANSLDVPPQFQRIDDDHFAYSSFWHKSAQHEDLKVQSQYYGVSNTIVLGSKHAKQNFRCHFISEDENKPILGKFSYSRLESKTNIKETKKYVLFIFHCKMIRRLASPHAVSFYSNSDTNPSYSPIIHMVDIDRKNKTRRFHHGDNKVSFENNYKIAACVMPNMLPIVSKREVIEFLSFHKILGISEFHVYDNSLSYKILERLQMLPIEILGFTLHVLPFNFPFSTENTYHVMRDLAELDCTFRNLNRNRLFEENEVHSYERISHIVNLAWNEYIVPRYHRSLKPFLGQQEIGKKVKLQLPTLHFCLNQQNDPKVKSDFPNVVKKTHFDKSITSERPCYIYNIGSTDEKDITMSSAAISNGDNIQKTEKLSQEIIAIHKYIDCNDSGNLHQFEGAIFRFSDDLYSSHLYTLFRLNKIWVAEKTTKSS